MQSSLLRGPARLCQEGAWCVVKKLEGHQGSGSPAWSCPSIISTGYVTFTDLSPTPAPLHLSLPAASGPPPPLRAMDHLDPGERKGTRRRLGYHVSVQGTVTRIPWGWEISELWEQGVRGNGAEKVAWFLASSLWRVEGGRAEPAAPGCWLQNGR